MPASNPTRCGCGRCRSHDSGKRGPFTQQEFMQLIGVVNEPAPVEMPAALAVLSVALDEALAEHDANHQTWKFAYQRQHLGSSPPTAATTAELQDAQEGLQVAEKRLEAARSAYNAAQQAITSQQVAADYAADQRRQVAEKLARQEAALVRNNKRGLRALAAKVTGS